MVNQLIQDPNKLPKEYSAERLLSELNSLGISKGVSVLKNLTKVNSDLGRILANGSNIDESLVDVAKIKKLTQDVFLQGIHLLESTLEVAQQSSVSNLAELRAENDELLNELKGKKKGSSLYSVIQERLEKNQKNIELIKKKSDKIDELLCNAGLSTDALREIVLELPELVKHKAKGDYDAVVAELNERIGFAQRVKAEYDKQGI